jgi:hypothetical protein
MNELQLPLRADRPLQVWEYVVSHAQLLLRSPRSAQRHTNLDVVCDGVEAMHLRPLYAISDVRIATPQESSIIGALAGSRRAGASDIVVGGSVATGFLRCTNIRVTENDEDLWFSPLDFSAIRRASSGGIESS